MGRSGTGGANNTMTGDLDMNGNDIRNVDNIVFSDADSFVKDSDFGSDGLLTRVTSGTYLTREIIGGTGIDVTNGTGVSGDPTLAIDSTVLTTTSGISVAQGGTGATSFTDGGVLLGSGTGAITPMGALANSAMIVGDGTTDPVAESGATLRTSIGVGTGDNVTHTDIIATGTADVQGDLTGTTATFSGIVDGITPVSAADFTTKQYVDNVASGISNRDSVQIATTANITLSGEQTIDGVLTSTDDILVKNQSTTHQNGIYKSASGSWARSSEYTLYDDHPGSMIVVEEGSANGDSIYICTSNIGGTLNTTAITWQAVSPAATTLNNLTDTTLSSNTLGDVLTYTGSTWANQPPNIVKDTTPQLGGFLDTNSKFISHAQGANIASVAGDTNIWTNFDGNTVHVTGTNAITDFGTPKSAGDSMWVIFDAAASVVDSSTITVAGNTNYQAAANDLALVYALTTSTFLFMPFPNSGSSPVYDADTLKADTDDTLSGGYQYTTDADGTKTSGTYTPAYTGGNVKTATNGGAHTLAPQSGNGTIIIQYTNDGSAGSITTSGWDKVSGDSVTTTSGHDFMFYLTVVGAFQHLHVVALQ
jgi:hypothetical protein